MTQPGRGVYYCQRCKRQFICSWDTTDFVHECNSASSNLNNEEITNLGEFNDYTGSGGAVAQVNNIGITNKLQGTRGHTQFGMKLPPLTQKANNAQIFRVRQHLEYQTITDDDSSVNVV